MLRALITTAALALLVAPGASAATITSTGDTLVYSAAPGETNDVVVDGDDQQVTFSDDVPIQFPAGRCHQDDPEYPVSCDTPAGAVRIALGDGADRGSFGFSIPTSVAFSFDGGPGNDQLSGPRNGAGSATLAGGDGDDTLTSEDTADTLEGGAGNDKLNGGAGADVLRGGAGDDVLRGDLTVAAYADVLDGGPGSDTLDDYRDSDAATAAPVAITLDGLANDGRPGERDNVIGIERFDLGAARTFAGDNADNVFTAPEKGTAVHLSGAGGDDVLTATDSSGDLVEGGAGDDTLTGGFGDDTIVGGPGRDQIAGDRMARCNEWHCDVMDGFGNDTIDARDGNVDSVQCGPGIDTVKADPQDRVADDCEHVDRGAVHTRPHKPVPALVVLGSRRIAGVLRHGLRVRTGSKRRVKVTAHLGRIVVARGSGRGTVRLRFTKAGRKRLRHVRRASVTLAAGPARARVTLRA